MKHATLQHPLTVETERFDLRPVRRSDKGLIELYGGDLRVARMTTSIPHPVPPGLVEDLIARSISEESAETIWALDATKSGGGELMGLISLERLDRNQSEIAYWVAPAFWNTGLAREAVQALIEANPFGNDTMFASVFQDNPASAKVLSNCGFVYLGDAESYSLARDTTVPTWTYHKKLT